MERHFNNLEEAEIFAARMRSEGHEAEVLSESVPTLWGAAAIGDIRVVVYDADAAETAAPEAPQSPAASLAGRILYGSVVGAILVVLGWIALEIVAYLLKDGFLSAMLKTITAVSFLYALSAWSLLLAALFRRGRDRDSKLGLVVHALISIVATILSLTLLISDFSL
ncbi:MAG: hypothetical protein O3A87_08370 [Verrucomicrobia bacterium]|nr:hypothetical protein [Verrucomicrobiota bacterium]MDA1006477.1 hypothetical protein [Verrucomicrobiota bacterium]